MAEHSLGMAMVRCRVGKLARFAPDAISRHCLESINFIFIIIT